MDHFEEVIHISWWQRVKSAILGLIFAPLFLLVGFLAIKHGEIDHAKSTNGLKGVQEQVVSDTIFQEGQIIRYSDTIKAIGKLEDKAFDLDIPAIKLFRQVLTYQWIEIITEHSEKTMTGGKTKVKTYDYELGWADKLINSNHFKHKEGHENPKKRKYAPKFFYQKDAHIGAYKLGNRLYRSVLDYERLELNPSIIKGDKYLRRTKTKQIGYLQLDSEISQGNRSQSNKEISTTALFLEKELTPVLGNTKIVYWYIPTDVYTIIGKKQGSNINAIESDSLFIRSDISGGVFHSAQGHFGMIFQGNKTTKEMFRVTHKENDIMYNALRFCGLVFTVAGVVMLGAPLILLFAWIPVFGALWERIAYKFLWFIGTLLATSTISYYWFQNNNISNTTIWDWIFFGVVLLMLILTPKLRVGVSSGGRNVYSEDYG